MVDQERSRSGLDRAASRLDAADDFGPTGRAGMVGERPSEWASVNCSAAPICVARQPSRLWGVTTLAPLTASAHRPLAGCSTRCPRGAWGVHSGRRESGLAASATALHRFEQGSSHVGWHRKQ